MRGSSKPDIKIFRSESESLDALTVGRASIITIEMMPIALISFHVIITPKDSENHIDDCVQLSYKILTDSASKVRIAEKIPDVSFFPRARRSKKGCSKLLEIKERLLLLLLLGNAFEAEKVALSPVCA